MKSYFRIYKTPEGRLQLNVELDSGSGYRLGGPEFMGVSKLVATYEFTSRMLRHLRGYEPQTDFPGMLTTSARYVGTARHSFRPGEPALILGVEMVTPDNCVPRACYRVMYDDGVEDLCPIDDVGNYRIQS